MSSLLLVRFPYFHYKTCVLIYVPVCHPSLRTGWFLKLSANGHTRALMVFQHVYKVYSIPQTLPRLTMSQWLVMGLTQTQIMVFLDLQQLTQS